MKTHLVIADQDTIDALAVESAENPDVLHVNHREAYLNGDRWLFRTWAGVTPGEFAAADHIYRDGPPIRTGNPLDDMLPLIAACDLLGVDEL